MVRVGNSSCFGSKYKLWTVLARCVGASDFPSTSFINHCLGGDVREFVFLPAFHLFSHRLKVALHSVDPTEMQSMSENDLECFASARVKSPGTMLSSSALSLHVTLSSPASDVSDLSHQGK